MSMTPSAPIVNELEIVTPYRKEGDRLTPILTPTDASLVSYENASPEADFKGTNMKEALDTLFDRMPAMPDNGQLICTSKSTSAKTVEWIVPKGVYECLCLLMSPGTNYNGDYGKNPWSPGGSVISFYVPVTPGTTMVLHHTSALSVDNEYARFYVKGNAKASAYARTPVAGSADLISYSMDLPGAELNFSTRAGKSYVYNDRSEYKSKNFLGGCFRIKEEDLLHFALYGGTDAYKTPTDATSNKLGTHAHGPSGTNSNGYSGSYLNYSAGSWIGWRPYPGLAAVFWGPQIHV